MHITFEKIEKLVESKYLNRGKEIVREGMVKIEKVTTKSLSAMALGTGIYKIFLQEAGDSIIGRCSCPAFSDFGPCKHMAATGLAYLKAGYKPSEYFEERREEIDEIVAALSNATKEQLVAFITDLSLDDSGIMDLVRERFLEW